MAIGPYEVLGELARGGMGVVFHARDPRTERTVVLKLLRVSDPRTRERLAREAQAMGRLRHPHVVPLLDSGSHNGEPYLVLPYVPGESLQDRLSRSGPLPIEHAIRIGSQLVGGLQAVHALKLVHRDVKPANVLLDSHGDALLTDFGLVKDLGPGGQEVERLSLTGNVLGTPGYWPPEQAVNPGVEVGPPADVYALGATLYAALCGQPPRSGETLLEALAAFDVPIQALIVRRAEVPDWLSSLTQRCLATNPEERPSLAEVAAELAGARRLSRRWPLILTALTGTACALALGGAAIVRSRTTSAPQPSARRDEPVQGASFLAEALELMQGGDFVAAAARCTRALELNPESVAAYALRGRAEFKLGNLDRAFADAELALLLDGEFPGALLLRGQISVQRRDYELAFDDLDLALRVNPDAGPKAYTLRGIAHFKLGRSREALADAAHPLDRNPNDWRALRLRASAKAMLGDYEGSINDFDRLLANTPDDALALARRGSAKAALGQIDEALADLERAEAAGLSEFLDPTSQDHQAVVGTLRQASAEARTNRGLGELTRGNTEQAIAWFDAALERDPEFVRALVNRGFAKSEVGESLESALRDFDRALQLAPDLALAHSNRGRVLSLLGRCEEAVKACDRALELDSTLCMAYVNRGSAWCTLEVFDKASADCGQALSLQKDFPPALALSALVAFKQDRYEETILWATRSIEQGGNVGGYALRGAAHARLSQWNRALEDLNRALDVQPDHPLRS